MIGIAPAYRVGLIVASDLAGFVTWTRKVAPPTRLAWGCAITFSPPPITLRIVPPSGFLFQRPYLPRRRCIGAVYFRIQTTLGSNWTRSTKKYRRHKRRHGVRVRRTTAGHRDQPISPHHQECIGHTRMALTSLLISAC